MMTGKVREYNWRDITRLIFADCGLTTDEQARTRGELWFVGNFREPEHQKDTCIRITIYDKTFSERIEEHAGDY